MDVNKCTCVSGWQGARCQIGEIRLPFQFVSNLNIYICIYTLCIHFTLRIYIHPSIHLLGCSMDQMNHILADILKMKVTIAAHMPNILGTIVACIQFSSQPVVLMVVDLCELCDDLQSVCSKCGPVRNRQPLQVDIVLWPVSWMDFQVDVTLHVKSCERRLTDWTENQYSTPEHFV